MNLSFVPGDLYLTQNAEGFFVVTLASQKILSTKSERYALGKFRSLRAELEQRFPAHQATAEEKAELFQVEVADSILGHGDEKKPAASARISNAALFEIQTAFRSYCSAVEASDLSENSQATYMDMQTTSFDGCEATLILAADSRRTKHARRSSEPSARSSLYPMFSVRLLRGPRCSARCFWDRALVSRAAKILRYPHRLLILPQGYALNPSGPLVEFWQFIF